MSGKIFLNYRREDSAASAGRLYDRLETEFGDDQLFIDVDDIAAGSDFVKVLHDQVSKCDVMLAIIGPTWQDMEDQVTGKRRLENPDDFVRIEIEAALSRNIRVIPVLVDNADMPRVEVLPESLKPLSRRNAVRLTHERFRADSAGLIKSLNAALREAQAEAAAELKRQQQIREKAKIDARREAELEEQRRQEEIRQAAIAGLSSEEIAKAEELANWDFIKESRKEQTFRDHMARFPDGVTAHMARISLERLIWLGMNETARKTDLEAYLEEFPQGEHSEEAREKLDAIVMQEKRAEQLAHQKEQEDAAWQVIKDSSDTDTIKSFLADWPDGAHHEEAQQLYSANQRVQEDAAWQVIKDSTDPDTIKSFLADWPGGEHHSEAERLYRALSSGNTLAGWYVFVPVLLLTAILLILVVVALSGPGT